MFMELVGHMAMQGKDQGRPLDQTGNPKMPPAKVAPCTKRDVSAVPRNERTLPSWQGCRIQREAESQGPSKRLQRLGFSAVAPSEGFLSARPQAGMLRMDRSGIRHEQGMYGTSQHILIIGSLPLPLRHILPFWGTRPMLCRGQQSYVPTMGETVVISVWSETCLNAMSFFERPGARLPRNQAGSLRS